MQYVYVAGAGTDAAIDLAITKQTRLALYSLIGGFRSKDFGLHTTEAVACDIAKFNGKFIQPVDGNTFADSGGYSFIVGEKSPQDLPVMIDCYTVYLESEGDVFDYIFSLDIPFSLKYKEFNTRKNIFEANEKSLTESQEVLVNCKELQDKFFFVWHFKMKEQFKVWKSLYSSLGMDKVIRNHAVGGMVGLKKAAKISFCPFTGMSFYILNCHLQGPFAGDDFRMHYLGVYSCSDRFHIAFLEKLFNGYLSGVSAVQMSYDSINPIHTVRMNAAVPLYSFNGKQFDVFPSLLDVPEEVLHNIAVDDAHAQMVLSEIERRRAGLRLENSASFGPLNVYSNLQLDKFFSMVIDQYDLTGVIGKSSSQTSLRGCLTRIFNDIDKRYPKAFSLHMKDVIKLNLERTWSWHKWFTGKHDEATLDAKMSIEIDEIGFPDDLQ